MTKLFLKNMAVLLPMLVALSGCGGDGPSAGDGLEETDALLTDIPIAYIKRDVIAAVVVPEGEDQPDVEPFMNFEAYRGDSAAVYVLNRASITGIEKQITPAGEYDVRQLSVSYDGDNLLFAMRGPMVADVEGEDPSVQPAWGIWEYTFASSQLAQLTTGDAANHVHDIDPAYLADGRIIFSSSRQKTTQFKLGDEGKVQYRHLTEDGDEEETDARTFNLHILGTGRNVDAIKQVTFNQSHDFNPALASDGRVIFSRWDNHGAQDSVSLYRMNPDGSQMELLFGRNSENAGLDPEQGIRYTRPVALDDGRVLAQLKADNDQTPQIQFAALDVDNFIDVGVSVSGSTGAAIDMTFLGLTQTVPETVARDGRVSAAVATNDGTGRFIISWSICEVVDAAGDEFLCTDSNTNSELFTEATPFYALAMYDPATGALPRIRYAQEEIYYTDIVVGQSHSAPALIADAEDVERDNMGTLHIRSVYNLDGVFDDRDANAASTLTDMKDPTIVPVADRPASFLRISKQVPAWDEDTRDISGALFGVGNVMNEIVGYAEIQPDGSVIAKIPADIAFTFSIVNADGVRISNGGRHNNWMQLRPGETLTCNGCHVHQAAEAEIAHGRVSGLDVVNTGAPNDGAYPNTDPAMDALLGETMAQTRVRLDATKLNLSPDLAFVDVWGEEGSKAASFSYTYVDLVAGLTTDEAPYSAPVNFTSCLDDWVSNCRVVINYEEHIHPMWGKDRSVMGPDPDAADPDTAPEIVLEDHTCVSCHNYQPDPDNANDPRTAGNLNILEFPENENPAQTAVQQAFLGEDADLPATIPVVNAERYNSYDHLRRTHPRAVVEGGVLSRQVIVDIVDVLDDDGNQTFEQIPALDGDGNPTFVNGDVITEESPRDLSLNGSISGTARSGRFFTKMSREPAADEVDHRDWLTSAELKLLKEWSDLGGQYYNNPFDAPED
ncbi:hypothetical protein A9Q81_26850 [Gammaproteobacteria bacterium 42_54_T18]|nr:hypothetical protein A9Q81_26850 [Gammaproteobacteria bacterium 42_54_T18]